MEARVRHSFTKGLLCQLLPKGITIRSSPLSSFGIPPLAELSRPRKLIQIFLNV